jgi:hypothetical protein
MQISNSHTTPLTSGISNKPSAPIKNSVQSAESVTEIEKDQPSNKQTIPSIVIDEQAISLYEQSQESASSQTQPNKEDFSSASQDQPSAKNETAVASYQAVGNLAKRESVQQLFGVDLFA